MRNTLNHNDTQLYTERTPERVASIGKVIGVALLSGVMLGVFAATANPYYVCAVIAAAIIIILIIWQFEAALLIYVLLAFVPWGRTPDLAVGGSGFGRGLYVSEILLAFLLSIWCAKYIASALPRERQRSGFHIPILLYLCYSILNVVNSFVFWDPHVNRVHQYPTVNAIELGLRFLSAGAFAMAATSISSRKWLNAVTIFIMIPGIYNLFNALSGKHIPISAPWWSLVAILPVSYFWVVVLDKNQKSWARLCALILVAVAIEVIFVRDIAWVSGWAGLIVSLATVTLVHSRKLFVVGLAVILIAITVSWPFLQKNVVEVSEKEGDYDRFALLAGAWRYATTFPLGIGLGNYRSYNTFYYGEEWHTTSYSSAHGTYAQHLSEMGIPGLTLFLCILFFGGRWLIRSYRSVENRASRTYLLAVFGQLVGISCSAFIGDYILPTYHNGGIVSFSATVYSWLYWGLAVAHVRLSRSATNGSFDSDRQLEHARSTRPVSEIGI